MKKLFAEFRSEKDKRFHHVELCYSSLTWISGNHKWFCRIWRKDWLEQRPLSLKNSIGESYGRNKFEAYRLALKNLELQIRQKTKT